MRKKKPKGIHEAFAQFFEQPTRQGLRNLLQEHFGEFDHLDFKQDWPSDPRLAKHVLGFANSGGGALVVGVRESSDKTFLPEGITKMADKTEKSNSLKRVRTGCSGV